MKFNNEYELLERIAEEHAEFRATNSEYADGKNRRKYFQCFTNPKESLKMLKLLTNLNGTIFDPTMGSGNLLAAAIIAGADPKKVYGNEIDPDIYVMTVERLTKLGVPKENLKNGDILEYFENEESLFQQQII